MAKTTREPFILDASREQILATIAGKMREMADGNPDAEPTKTVLAKNADAIAGLVVKASADAKTELTHSPGLTGDEIAKRIASNVQSGLREASQSADPRYAVSLFSLFPEFSTNAIHLASKRVTGYYSKVYDAVRREIAENLAAHEEQFAALKQTQKKPADVAAEPAQQPPAVTASAGPAVARLESAAAPAPQAPPQLEMPATSQPASPPAAEPPKASAGEKEPPKGILAKLAGTIIPPAAAAETRPGETPPPSTPAAPFSPPASSAPSAQHIPIPRSLSEIFNNGGAAALTAFADPESLKGLVREGVRKMGGDPANFSDHDIDGMASAIQEAGMEWFKKHQDELGRGDVSRTRISALSVELAMNLRGKMTPDRVGKFAGGMGPFNIVDVPDMVTGVDRNGRILDDSQMNIFSMAQTALTAQYGNAEAKTRMQERLAHDESYRAFYDAQEEGLTPSMASQTALYRMQRSGGYSDYTQTAVQQMAEHAFSPSWTDGIGKLFFYIMEFFKALFSGDIGSFMVGLKDGSISANRREKAATDDNFTLYHKIVGANAQMLGYTGSPDGFSAWKQQLATDVTGIYYSYDRRAYTDINPTDGSTQGISAVIQGLNPDGYGTVPGMENVHGARHAQADKPSDAPTGKPAANGRLTAPTLGPLTVPNLPTNIQYRPGEGPVSPAHGLPTHSNPSNQTLGI